MLLPTGNMRLISILTGTDGVFSHLCVRYVIRAAVSSMETSYSNLSHELWRWDSGDTTPTTVNTLTLICGLRHPCMCSKYHSTFITGHTQDTTCVVPNFQRSTLRLPLLLRVLLDRMMTLVLSGAAAFFAVVPVSPVAVTLLSGSSADALAGCCR